MKATIRQFKTSYMIVGLRELEEKNGMMMYEMKYLFSLGSKTYKTEKNAIKAILREGFEYIPTVSNQLVCAYD